jgi:rhomboid protease GluP
MAMLGMEPNAILLWMTGLTCAITVVRLLRLRAATHRSWLAVNAVVLCVIGVGMLFFPERAGYVALALWLVLVLSPGLGVFLIQQSALRMQLTRARRIALVVRCLHPFGAWRRQLEMLRAWELAATGDFAAAERLLQQSGGSDTQLSRTAELQILRLKGEWEECAEWIDRHGGAQTMLDHISFTALYLRVLGETGRLSLLLKTFQDAQAKLAAQPSRIIGLQCRLMILAFFGRRSAVAHLLETELAAAPEAQRLTWRATADMAAGDVDAARNRLRVLRDRSDAMTRIAIERRLSHPVADATQLTDEQNAALLRIERELSDEARFGDTPRAARGRAYATGTLIVANVIGFALEILAGSTTAVRTLYGLGGLWPVAVVRRGEWWRLFAAQFLHAGAAHLIVNMLGLLLFGPYLEFMLGRLRYLGVYLLTGTAAEFLVVLMNASVPASHQPLSVGASGGVLGLVGATAGVMLLAWRRERAQLARQRLLWMVFILITQAAFDLSRPHASFTAHISGAIVGFLVTLLLGYRT